VSAPSRAVLTALLGTALLALLHPRVTLADWTDFLPRTLDNGAYIEVQGLFEEDDNRYAERSFRWTDTFFKEKLTLFSDGYVYHPRFLLFHAAVTGLVSQERYETSLAPSDEWRRDDGLEYDLSLRLLPEHAYNLHLFARRYEPLFTERAASRENSVATSEGADFRYRKKPYFLHARYSDETLTSATLSSGVQRLGLDGEYFKQYGGDDYFSLTAAFNPSRFDRSTGLEGETREALLGNLLAFGRYRLSSNLSSTRLEQDDQRRNRFESDQFIWRERFDVELPLDFRGELDFRHQENDSRYPDAAPGQARELSNLSRDFSAVLSHQLFDSLTSSYSFTRSTQESIFGESSANAHQLTFSYDKEIPRGRLLLGSNFGASELDSVGRTDVVSEPHPGVAVPGSFALRQENVEPASIVLFVRSPVSPFEEVRLAEGVHYVVATLVNALEIQVLSLPPQFVLPGSYNFTASYSLAGSGFRLGSRYGSVNASVQLFDERLTPYASYSTVESEVRSGLYPGAIPDSSTTTAGLLFRLGGLRARGEYRNVEWETSPYSMWLGELQYTGALSRSTRLHATASHRRWDYPQGRQTSAGLPRAAAVQTTDLVAVDLQQNLFRRRLMLSLGGSYSENRNYYDSRAHSLNATLSWKIGRTFLSAGATIYSSEAEGTGIAISERTRRLYYLQLRRDLF
jgi:hypothetical protein